MSKDIVSVGQLHPLFTEKVRGWRPDGWDKVKPHPLSRVDVTGAPRNLHDLGHDAGWCGGFEAGAEAMLLGIIAAHRANLPNGGSIIYMPPGFGTEEY